jgi:hypothetical protein
MLVVAEAAAQALDQEEAAAAVEAQTAQVGPLQMLEHQIQAVVQVVTAVAQQVLLMAAQVL